MSEKRFTLLIAERALRDLADIEAYSATEWGNRVAARYIEDIEAALVRIQKQPNVLQSEEALHPWLCFHRVNRHVLVCDRQPHAVFLLAVIHATRDIPSRLAELAPTITSEIKILHEQLARARSR